MTAYVLSPRARTDIDRIWTYSRSQWGLDQAEAYLRYLQQAIETIAADPRRGRACDHIRPGYFKLNCRSHVLFYRMAHGGVDVVRILHQQMDFDRHL
ncbi:type II toxin-antitoxin system RelE/ParE family toxin [Devosia sp.]|uniref:type II toxin-antitoxin system RelE/ParE family toxin n=1 Tax=Devosia sp. TaxID=1871048 RepID=UPI002FC86C8E